VHVAYGSVLFWWRCDTLCTSGFVDDITFSHNSPEVHHVYSLATMVCEKHNSGDSNQISIIDEDLQVGLLIVRCTSGRSLLPMIALFVFRNIFKIYCNRHAPAQTPLVRFVSICCGLVAEVFISTTNQENIHSKSNEWSLSH